MSAVRRLQANSSSFVFRYAAIRLLEIEVFLDRRYVAKSAIDNLTLTHAIALQNRGKYRQFYQALGKEERR